MRYYFILLSIFIFSATAQSATPPKIQLATRYHQDINIQDYWVSEKLDGVRGYWDGQHLLSRQGNIFNCPLWFTKNFPTTPLDGELWIDRQQFALTSGIVRKQKASDEEWQKITFMIFDMPTSSENFSKRIQQMKNIIKNSKSPYLKMIQQQKMANNTELHTLLDNVLSKGGEGLMLHKGSAFYQAKRSKDLMKLKKYQDAEAVILQQLPGKGRNKGRLGAILVKAEDGTIFKIGGGFSDIERDNPPAVGTIITYQYIGKTKNGIPRFASFLRVKDFF